MVNIVGILHFGIIILISSYILQFYAFKYVQRTHVPDKFNVFFDKKRIIERCFENFCKYWLLGCCRDSYGSWFVK
jgi:hypothetical protein